MPQEGTEYFAILMAALFAFGSVGVQEGWAQQPPAATTTLVQRPATPVPPQDPLPTAVQPTPGSAEALRPSYVLGTGDVVLIRAVEAEEINEKPFRVDAEGLVNLPLVGMMRAGGLTVAQFEANLIEKLKTYIRSPQVVVSVVQFRSEPVFMVGAFRTPGIHPLQGRRTLLELLVSTGGVLPNASQRIRLSRRAEFGPIPLPNAVDEPDGMGSTVIISLASLRESINPPEDLVLQPFDVITAERAEMIYVTGAVMRVGSYELEERESITAAKLIAISGGLAPGANARNARLLRPVLDTQRRAEIPLDLRSIMEGRSADFPLMANDILYVPERRVSRSSFWWLTPVIAPVIAAVVYVTIRDR